jgi:hypothetical protein
MQRLSHLMRHHISIPCLGTKAMTGSDVTLLRQLVGVGAREEDGTPSLLVIAFRF